MNNTTCSGNAGIRDVTQWLIEHYNDDDDKLNFDPTPEQLRRAYDEIGAEPPRDTKDYFV